MEQRTTEMLFALLRSAIRGTSLTEKERDGYAPEQLEDLLKVSAKCDVGHLLAFGLKQNGLIPEGNTDIEKRIFKAVFRHERQQRDYEKLCAALEKAQIQFLPLKGSVIREYYPQTWMRTSCDIDILVRAEEAEKAKELLINEYRYTYQKTGPHDISLFSPTNIHIELHYDLVEKGTANEASAVLKKVWDMLTVREGYVFWHEMPDELYYFYHIAHMAKHFENGGCGIRPFIDLWILDNLPEADKKRRDDLLERGKLLKFAESSRRLSRIWFEGEKYDVISGQMEAFLLNGGVYGNRENHIIVQQQKKGGRLKYALSKIFLPYDVIKFYYPILLKHPWLTPFMEVRRWCKLIFCGELKRTTNELIYNSNVSEEKAMNTRKFLSNIGL